MNVGARPWSGRSQPTSRLCSPQDRLDEKHPRAARVSELVRGAGGQQCLVPTSTLDPSHLLAFGLVAQRHGALLVGWHDRLIGLDVVHLDLAVHDERRLIVSGGKPRRVSLGAQCLDHVLEILADRHLLVGLRFRRHLEDIRKCVMLRVVVDDLYAPLLVVLEGTELRLLATHLRSLLRFLRGDFSGCWTFLYTRSSLSKSTGEGNIPRSPRHARTTHARLAF